MFKAIVIIFRFFAALAALTICAAGYYYGRHIPFEKQWPLYEALRTTASIIFAVIGAWLAIIYPERLKVSFRGNGKGGGSNGNLGLLLTPAVHSTIILALLLLLGICAPIVKEIPVVRPHVEMARGISFVILSALTIWQVIIVFMTLFPAQIVQEQIAKESAKRAIDDQYGKLRNKSGTESD
ncbi:hypothetical protein MMZ06_31620 [Burkholderia gladioli]|uniref:hypothetical protein n=1 Tax=Burkholderia gladioli TaxID=28095 RepID=UPI001F4B01DC|nr:hypothetical protein [Burkholderia gladioli]MCH7274382.1 hypothetical protein [Burkholderia gladioli]MEB2552376.1 hypothetical protein [Burkholderia gladioli]